MKHYEPAAVRSMATKLLGRDDRMRSGNAKRLGEFVIKAIDQKRISTMELGLFHGEIEKAQKALAQDRYVEAHPFD